MNQKIATNPVSSSQKIIKNSLDSLPADLEQVVGKAKCAWIDFKSHFNNSNEAKLKANKEKLELYKKIKKLNPDEKAFIELTGYEITLKDDIEKLKYTKAKDYKVYQLIKALVSEKDFGKIKLLLTEILKENPKNYVAVILYLKKLVDAQNFPKEIKDFISKKAEEIPLAQRKNTQYVKESFDYSKSSRDIPWKKIIIIGLAALTIVGIAFGAYYYHQSKLAEKDKSYHQIAEQLETLKKEHSEALKQRDTAHAKELADKIIKLESDHQKDIANEKTLAQDQCVREKSDALQRQEASLKKTFEADKSKIKTKFVKAIKDNDLEYAEELKAQREELQSKYDTDLAKITAELEEKHLKELNSESQKHERELYAQSHNSKKFNKAQAKKLGEECSIMRAQDGAEWFIRSQKAKGPLRASLSENSYLNGRTSQLEALNEGSEGQLGECRAKLEKAGPACDKKIEDLRKALGLSCEGRLKGLNELFEVEEKRIYQDASDRCLEKKSDWLKKQSKEIESNCSAKLSAKDVKISADLETEKERIEILKRKIKILELSSKKGSFDEKTQSRVTHVSIKDKFDELIAKQILNPKNPKCEFTDEIKAIYKDIIGPLQDKVKSLTEEKTKVEREYKTLKETPTTKPEDLTACENKTKEVNEKYNAKVKEYDAKVKEYDEKVKELEKFQGLQTKYNELVISSTTVVEELEKFKKLVVTNKQTIEKLNKANTELQSKIDEFVSDFETLRSEIDSIEPIERPGILGTMWNVIKSPFVTDPSKVPLKSSDAIALRRSIGYYKFERNQLSNKAGVCIRDLGEKIDQNTKLISSNTISGVNLQKAEASLKEYSDVLSKILGILPGEISFKSISGIYNFASPEVKQLLQPLLDSLKPHELVVLPSNRASLPHVQKSSPVVKSPVVSSVNVGHMLALPSHSVQEDFVITPSVEVKPAASEATARDSLHLPSNKGQIPTAVIREFKQSSLADIAKEKIFNLFFSPKVGRGTSYRGSANFKNSISVIHPQSNATLSDQERKPRSATYSVVGSQGSIDPKALSSNGGSSSTDNRAATPGVNTPDSLPSDAPEEGLSRRVFNQVAGDQSGNVKKILGAVGDVFSWGWGTISSGLNWFGSSNTAAAEAAINVRERTLNGMTPPNRV